jgi:hypothetical protein
LEGQQARVDLPRFATLVKRQPDRASSSAHRFCPQPSANKGIPMPIEEMFCPLDDLPADAEAVFDAELSASIKRQDQELYITEE